MKDYLVYISTFSVRIDFPLQEDQAEQDEVPGERLVQELPLVWELLVLGLLLLYVVVHSPYSSSVFDLSIYIYNHLYLILC